MMFGAITALTLSLVWAAQLMPGGMPHIPGLLSIGSVVKAPPGSINFDSPREKRCGYDVRAEMIQEEAQKVHNRAQSIRIEVEKVRASARRHNIVVQRKHQHRHEQKQQRRHEHKHPHKRKRCRSRMTANQPAMPIPPIPPIPPVPPLAPIAPTAPLAP